MGTNCGNKKLGILGIPNFDKKLVSNNRSHVEVRANKWMETTSLPLEAELCLQIYTTTPPTLITRQNFSQKVNE